MSPYRQNWREPPLPAFCWWQDSSVVAVGMPLVLFLLAFCGGFTPAPLDVVRSAAYGGELDACVKNNLSRAATDACRADVDCRYQQAPCPGDAGARDGR